LEERGRVVEEEEEEGASEDLLFLPPAKWYNRVCT
jgi:hypothetical protein